MDSEWEIHSGEYWFVDASASSYLKGRIEFMMYNKDLGIVLFIDVKPEINSLQAVVGQMKMYETIRNIRIEKIQHYDSYWPQGYVHREITDDYKAYYIIISRNVTNEQREYLEISGLYIIDIKDLI